MKFLILSSMLALLACMSGKKANNAENEKPLVFGNHPTYIYKTSHDYFNNVPVTLSADKNTIVSYPGPGDVYYAGKLAYPMRLKNDYLLDNRGININVAFLKYTYDEYSQLKIAPSLDELYTLILDKNPLTALYDCGSREQYTDPDTFDNLVNENFKRCKKIK